MALKTLHEDVQNIISASIKISSYKTAIEEMIYNALDAESTSIAVRISIQENTIQVIDNGRGISSKDFPLLGERYATSKCADLSTLKSVPNKYGYRGQFLSALIQVSEILKVTSRSEDSEETWCKVFEERKEKDLFEIAKRPSKGTTVEIKGFLHNLKIRKKSINPLQEIREVKSFLEQLSLVHSNVSISLRDDSNNDIVFKIHKHRDIYQTLSTLFNVEKTDVQELTVEKSHYKTIAYISKKDKDISSKHWIFVNGRLTQSVRLYKMINDQMRNSLKLNKQARRKIKSRKVFYEEDKCTSDDRLPFYVIFITCPYCDYDISHTPKHSMLEFKNWENINKLLDKLIKFYTGDMNLKDAKVQNADLQPKSMENDTRDQVRKIVEKMLGNTIKRPGVSQLQNGINGKPIKRKPKKPNASNKKDAAVLKVIPEKSINCDDILIDAAEKPVNNIIEFLENCTKNNKNPEIKSHKKKAPKRKIQGKLEIKTVMSPIQHKQKYKDKNVGLNAKNNKLMQNQIKIDNKGLIESKHKQNSTPKSKTTVNVANFEINKHMMKENDMVLAKYSELGNALPDKSKRKADIIKRNCAPVNKNVADLLKRKKTEPEIFVDHTLQAKKVAQGVEPILKNLNLKEDKEKIFYDSSISISCSPCTFDNRNWKKDQRTVCTTNYDLLHTIVTIRTNENTVTNAPKDRVNSTYHSIDGECMDLSKYFKKPQDLYDDPESYVNDFKELALTETLPELTLPDPALLESTSVSSHSTTKTQLTYVSHNYGRYQFHQPNLMNKQTDQQNLITTHSRNNLDIRDKSKFKDVEMCINNRLHNHFKPYMIRKSVFNKNKTWIQDMEDTEYTIEFSNSKERYQCYGFRYQHATENQLNINGSPSLQQDTYTIIEESDIESDHHNIKYQTNLSAKSSLHPQRAYCAKPVQRCRYEDRVLECDDFAQNNNALVKIDENIDNHDKIIAKNNDYQGIIETTGTLSQANNNKGKQREHQSKICETTHSQDEENNDVLSLHPLDICETVLSQDIEESLDNRITYNDSLFKEGFDSILLDRNIYIDTSNFDAFDIPDCDTIANNVINAVERNEMENNLNMEELNQKDNEEVLKTDQTANVNVLKKKTNSNINDFNIKIRPRFIPKGLSPIFENCRTKTACGHELEKDYYEDRIYNNFASKIIENTEIFEPQIQEMKELTTKDIEKVNSRQDKENASLVFDAKSLNSIQVLNQVDNKFIAAKIKGNTHHGSRTAKEYFVMFDQHAVHERIRLENNLADYFNGLEWNSVALEEVTIKLSKDEILFLHNYKDKFMQFGLEWTITGDCEVSITAIPEAVLGKNPRQVDVVIKAIKNLISEEIAAIKSQRGCIVLYPKSIMELVFSEACRYAIKFGDRLSKSECQRLIKSLSECKTPFQCAHGRPVMAVLMEVKHHTMEYKANVSRIQQFRKMMKKIA